MDIKKIFERANSRDIAFTYLIKKVSELPLKAERIKISKSLIEFLNKEQEETKKTVIFNTGCVNCRGDIDQEDGKCYNCGIN